MNQDKIKELWDQGWISAGVIAASFLYLLRLSWGRWGDLVVDTGREMYVPAVLANGEVLYRDIFYLYGPFSPYFHALLFKIFGIHLNALILSGMITAGAAVFLIYRISRQFLNVFFSTLTSLVFLFVFAFGHYLFLGNYNFIIPYSYPATHAMVFSLAALYYLFLWIDQKRMRTLIICAAFIFFALIARVEMGLMLAAAIACACGVLKFSRKDPDFQGAYFAWLFVFPVLIAGFIYSILFSAAGDTILTSKLFSFASTNTLMDNPFTSWLSGTDDAAGNVLIMARSLLLYVILGFWFLLGGFLGEMARAIQEKKRRRKMLAVVAAVFLAAAIVFMKFFFPFDLQYRSMPVFLIVALIITIIQINRADEKKTAVKMLALTVFSMFVLLRILLNTHPMHYGFSLLVPGLIVYHIVLFRMIPKFFQKQFIRSGFMIGFVCVAGILGFQHAARSYAAYQYRTIQIASPLGSMRVFNDDKDIACAQLIQYLIRETRPDDSVVVLPEGLTINFLSARTNPLYYYSYMPPDFFQEGIERDVIRGLARNRVDYIVLLDRSLSEYGVRAFGKDYAKDLWAYVQGFYELDQQFGPFPYTSDRFGIAVFKRKVG